MEPNILLRGMVLGFWIAAPVGPIGVLCIRRTLGEGRLLGFVSGLGAATADALYGFVAAFGLTALASVLLEYQLVLRVVGGLYLCYLGLRTLTSTPGEEVSIEARIGLLGAYTSTLALTLANPATIIAFTAILGSLGTSRLGSFSAPLALVLGVFVGWGCWWLLLTGGIGLFRSRITRAHLGWINRIAGNLHYELRCCDVA